MLEYFRTKQQVDDFLQFVRLNSKEPFLYPVCVLTSLGMTLKRVVNLTREQVNFEKAEITIVSINISEKLVDSIKF